MREIVFAIIFVLIGLIPWFCEKRGMSIPGWVVITGGSVTVLGIGGLLCHAVTTHATQWNHKVQMWSIGIIMLITGGIGTWWITYPTPFDYRKLPSDKQETLSLRTFANETVDIDGKIFDRCKFQNVTLIYHGLAPPTFITASFSGVVTLQTDNQAAKDFASLSANLRKQPNVTEFLVAEKDSKGNINVLFRETKP